MPVYEKIEILSVYLLEEHRETVVRLRKLAKDLRMELGWHYLLDLTWILDHLGIGMNAVILDAGAGTGLIQWHLAEQGHTVISVDRGDRSHIQVRFRKRYNVEGLRQGDLSSSWNAFAHDLKFAKTVTRKANTALVAFYDWLHSTATRPSPGKVTMYNQDLSTLEDLAENSVDAIVSVSALEHNPPETLPAILDELLRVLKPGGVLLATLCASPDPEADTFHKYSQGWCYSEQTLRKLFRLDSTVRSNYDEYQPLFEKLNLCAELRDNLASFYFRSGDNGMPWGKWDPQYQPVGVLKVKARGAGDA